MIALLAAWALAAAALAAADAAPPALTDQVRAAERAFAKTMADRDLAAFGTFVSEEAIFLGRDGVLRGRAQVIEGWKRFYEGKEAPFSWEPEQVEVLASGDLALTRGPVLDAKGKREGSFSSVWRHEADGRWRVIFDQGCPPCSCP